MRIKGTIINDVLINADNGKNYRYFIGTYKVGTRVSFEPYGEDLAYTLEVLDEEQEKEIIKPIRDILYNFMEDIEIINTKYEKSKKEIKIFNADAQMKKLEEITKTRETEEKNIKSAALTSIANYFNKLNKQIEKIVCEPISNDLNAILNIINNNTNLSKTEVNSFKNANKGNYMFIKTLYDRVDKMIFENEFISADFVKKQLEEKENICISVINENDALKTSVVARENGILNENENLLNKFFNKEFLY